MSSDKSRVRTGLGSEEASRALALALNTWLEEYGASAIFKTCENCHYMTPFPEPAHCMKYNMVPPAGIITRGCPSHTDREEIPF